MSQSTSDCAKPLHTHLTLEDIRKMMDEETEAMKSEDEDIDEDIDEEGDEGEGLSVKEQARKQRKEDDKIPGRAPRSMETLQVMRRDDILQVGDRKDTRRDVYLCACEQDEVDGKKNRVRRTGDNIFDLVCACNKSKAKARIRAKGGCIPRGSTIVRRSSMALGWSRNARSTPARVRLGPRRRTRQTTPTCSSHQSSSNAFRPTRRCRARV